MPQYSWANCPSPAQEQVLSVVDAFKSLLGSNLIGIYLHGSLAMDCFNPQRSDIDILAVNATRLSVHEMRDLAEAMLALSVNPHPVEVSILSQSGLCPWEHPAPYEFHYSEDHRDRIAEALANGAWTSWNASWDPDLAAHVMVTHKRGICLFGEPINLVFPQVPAKDYADSILSDFNWAWELVEQDPAKMGVYFVLNACRIYAYLLEGYVFSKDEGGRWGRDVLPADMQPLIDEMLAVYRGEREASIPDEGALRRFTEFVEGQINAFSR